MFDIESLDMFIVRLACIIHFIKSQIKEDRIKNNL